jgi:hypothetical protein
MVTTSNCNVFSNTCTRLLTTAHTKSSQVVFTSRFLVTNPNNILYLRPYWLANVSQLNPTLAVISQQPPTLLKLKLKLCYDRWSVGQSVLVSSAHLWLTKRFLLLSDSCRFVDVGRSLWRENGSAVYNCRLSSPVQSFLGPSPEGLVTIFYSDSRLPQPGGPCPRIYIP